MSYINKFFGISITAILILSITYIPTRAQTTDIQNQLDQLLTNKEFDATRIIVKFRDSEPSIQKFNNNWMQQNNIAIIPVQNSNKTISSITERKIAITQEEKDNVRQELEKYLNDPRVEYAQPNYVKTLTAWTTTTTTAKPSDYNDTRNWYNSLSKLPEMWKQENCPSGTECGGSSNVVVAVLDSGVAFEDFDDTDGFTSDNFGNSPNLSGMNVWVNNDPSLSINGQVEIPNNGIDEDCNNAVDDYNGIDTYAFFYADKDTCPTGSPVLMTSTNYKAGHPVDTVGHGTFVADTIAGQVDNGNTISSAFDVTIMPIAISTHYSSNLYTEDEIVGINYAVFYGADVINMSFSSNTYDQAESEIITYALSQNVVLVAATGNDGSTELNYPASYPGVIGAGAVNADGTRSSYSNYGVQVDISAYVGSTASSGLGAYQMSLTCFFTVGGCDSSDDLTAYSNGYSIGTSFAAPQISAAAALILSRNNTVGYGYVSEILENSTDDLGTAGKDTSTGSGVLNYQKLLSNFPLVQQMWLDSGIGNWDATRSILLTSGDYDNDGDDDIATMYRYNNNRMGLWVFRSNGTNSFINQLWYDSGIGNWDATRSLQLTSGDFDNDGDDDIATMYKYDNFRTGLWVFKSNGSNAFTNQLWYDSGNGNWDATRSLQLSSGDFDNDNDADIATMYRYDNYRMGLWVFKSNGSNTFTSQMWLDTGFGNWDATRSLQITSGEYDNDSDADLATMYRYNNNRMGLWVFNSNGSNAFTSQMWYDSGNGNWDATRSTLITSGDFDNDNDDDIATMYRYDNNKMGIWTFKSNNSNAFSSSKKYDSGYNNWDSSRSPQFTSGNYNNAASDEVATMYRYNNNQMGIWVFIE